MDYLSFTKAIVLKHIDGQNHKVFLFGSREFGNVSNFSVIDIRWNGNKTHRSQNYLSDGTRTREELGTL